MMRHRLPVIPSRVKHMLLAVFVGRGLMAMRQIIIVPVMIWAWGTEYYGAWLILSAIPTFMAMSNMGVGTASRIRATLEFAAGDVWLAKRTIRLGSTVVAVVGTLVVGVVYFGMHWLVKDGATIRLVAFPNAVVAILMATTFVQMFASPFDAIWVGMGKAPFPQNAGNILNIVTIMGMIGVVLLKDSALTLAVTCLVITSLWSAIYTSLSRRAAAKVSGAEPAMAEIVTSWSLTKELVWRGLGFQAGSLWQAILFQGSIVVAGSLLGASGAALWGAMRVIIRSGNQFLDLIGQTVAPEFQMAFAKGDRVKLAKNYRAALLFGVAASTSIMVFLLLFGHQIFNLWTRNSFHVPYAAWATLCVSLIPFSLWWNGSVLQSGLNRPWMVNVFGIFSAAVSVGLMRMFGAGGITYFSAFALLFDVMMALFIFPHSLSVLKEKVVPHGAALVKAKIRAESHL